MTAFRQQFSSIKGLSDRRRLPRLNKIRLGFKVKSDKGEYPAELPFFLLPPEVAREFGFKDAERSVTRAKEMGCSRDMVLKFIRDNYSSLAEEIEIMFPINDREVVMPVALKYYGSSSGIKCQGNGEEALRSVDVIKEGNPTIIEGQPKDAKMIRVECPCGLLKTEENPKGACTQRGALRFMVPKVNMGGVYEIPFSSINSIIDVQSGLDYIAGLTAGRFCMIPLTLRRIPTQTHHNNQKQVHFTMQVIFNVSADVLNELRAGSNRVITQSSAFILPPPDDTNPIAEPADLILEQEPTTEYEVDLQAIYDCGTVADLSALWKHISEKHRAGKYGEGEYEKLADAKNTRKATLEKAA